uniref:aldehyde dehydrogenase family protein n=1 Tax=uncultured Sphingomonas sp. TaxID=158754 RepID=UPI0035CBB056
MLPEGKLYIDGQLRDAAGGAVYDDIGPWTGEIVGKAADASVGDMEEAIAAARRAFDETDWSTNHALRRDLVVKLGGKLKANRDRLVDIAKHETGSAMGAIYGPQVDSPLGHYDELITMFDSFEWERSMGERENWGATSTRIVVREAMGVVGAITPWNVPFYIAVGKVVPALLAGCTVILKPAPETPLFSAILGELAHEVGFPAGVFNVLTAKDPATLGEMLVTDKRVDLISFTGSTGIGKRIMEKGAATLKRVFLELGGKSASIVLEDAPNFAETVSQSIVCFHAGQGCAINTRLLVPKSRYAEAVAVLEATYAGYSGIWGDPDAPTNVMGPVISARQRERVMGYIQSGQDEGARLIAGGNAPTDKGGGFFIEPTCFVDVTSDMKIAREEIFGPVLVVIPFEDDDDAVRIANDSDYGLSGSVMSGNLDRAMKVARRIRTGTLGVNGGTWSSPDMPFGGYKQSGVGREWGQEGFEEYLETKSIGYVA